MQLLGARHPHVLGSAEVLQDDDYLFSIMPRRCLPLLGDIILDTETSVSYLRKAAGYITC